jgi:hypothetical protein
MLIVWLLSALALFLLICLIHARITLSHERDLLNRKKALHERRAIVVAEVKKVAGKKASFLADNPSSAELHEFFEKLGGKQQHVRLLREELVAIDHKLQA